MKDALLKQNWCLSGHWCVLYFGHQLFQEDHCLSKKKKKNVLYANVFNTKAPALTIWILGNYVPAMICFFLYHVSVY